jgi:transposase
MEDVLYQYSLPYDPEYPLVCFDERPCFLIGDVLTPIPMEAGQPKRQHYEYEKNGSCTVFIAFHPATGRRWVKVYEKRTGKEYTQFMQHLVKQFPKANKMRLIQDNLSTHSASSFYAHLKPAQALTLAQRLVFHFTPTKSSWLNMAELELSALSRQCLNRRIASISQLQREVVAWATQRNREKVTVNWQFSIELAREKFVDKYPKVK